MAVGGASRLAGFVLCAALAACGTVSSSPSAPSGQPAPSALEWPTATWEAATPESEGLDSATLAAGLRELADHGSRVHSLTIIRHGRIVLDAYKYPYDGSIYHDLASVTKSVTSTLVGVAIQQGLLQLDAPMVSFFPDRVIANRDPRKEAITVRDLLTNTSGLDCRVTTEELTLRQMQGSDDFVQFALDLPAIHDPGETFAYCSPGFHLLSAIVAQASGMSTLDYARANLFGPLGITDVHWPADAQGVTHGWGDLALHPRDAARIGLLLLRQGRWQDAQLLPPDWVAAATSLQAETHGFKAEDYGYGWWVSRAATEPIAYFRADGNGGQRIWVIPDLDLVVAMTGGGSTHEEIAPFLVNAATDGWRPLPEDPDGVRDLESAVAALAVAPDPLGVPELPPTAEAVSGRAVLLDANPYGITSLTFTFDPRGEAARARLEIDHESPPRAMVIGLDGLWRASTAGRPILARGGWADETVFEMQVDEGPGVAQYTVRVAFEGQRVTVSLLGVVDEAVTIDGHLD